MLKRKEMSSLRKIFTTFMRKYFPLTSSDDSYLTYTSQKKIIQYDASYFPVVLTSTIGNGRGCIEKDTIEPDKFMGGSQHW